MVADRQAHSHRTAHPHPTALPRQERDERTEQPEGGDTNTYGRGIVAASRCPAPRDSPALVRQEGDV